MNVDQDGFLVSDEAPEAGLVAAPTVVAVPRFFEGCSSLEDAAIKALSELSKPYSYEMEGIDEMYRRLANAMTVLLAKVAGVEP